MGSDKRLSTVIDSVAEVQFSPVLPPFLENRELNRKVWAGTEPEPEPNRVEPVLPVLFCSVLGSDRRTVFQNVFIMNI